MFKNSNTGLIGGLTPSRLKWLYQKENVEYTLQLLCYLNYWAKARELLLYADRQGLYQVKAALLQQAYELGIVKAVGYIDGTKAFRKSFDLDGTASIGAESLCEGIENWQWFNQQDLVSPKKCPNCKKEIWGLRERLEHWHSEHLGNALGMRSQQLAWVLGNKNTAKIEGCSLPEPDRVEGNEKVAQENRKRKKKQKKPRPLWYFETLQSFFESPSQVEWVSQQDYLEQKERQELERSRTQFIDELSQALGQPISSVSQVVSLLWCEDGKERREAWSSALGTVSDWLELRLSSLVESAIQARQPLDTSVLSALYIMPYEVIEVDSNLSYGCGWEDLDESDLRKIDPEGLSLVTFSYSSPTAHFVFHLPYRIAEGFTSPEQLQQLCQTAVESREVGEYFGRSITEAESWEIPIDLLLKELGVDIDAVCPEGLVDKREYIQERERQRAERYRFYHSDDWDDEDWEDDIRDEQEEWYSDDEDNQEDQELNSISCPLCETCESTVAAERLNHWLNQHSEHEAVTVGQANWILGVSRDKVSGAIPFDLKGALCGRTRNMIPDVEGHTRFWKVETLSQFIRDRDVGK